MYARSPVIAHQVERQTDTARDTRHENCRQKTEEDEWDSDTLPISWFQAESFLQRPLTASFELAEP
jgi:hypothetical protein